jgi:predicted aspartyl protease
VSQHFNAARGLIVIPVEVEGSALSLVLRLALDTGATSTMLNQSRLLKMGYDLFAFPDRFQITTGSGVEFVPRVVLDKIIALGKEQTGFPVLAHTLPPSAGVDGLVGLDFLRGLNLNIDFRNGLITLS